MEITGTSPQGANQWYELQDLHVQDLLPQMITLAEAYIQVGHFSLYCFLPGGIYPGAFFVVGRSGNCELTEWDHSICYNMHIFHVNVIR